MSCYVLLSSATPLTEEDITRRIDSIKKFLPTQLQPDCTYRYCSNDRTLFLFLWTQLGATPKYLAEMQDNLFFVDGYIATLCPDNFMKVKDITFQQDSVIDFIESPGGVYSFIGIDKMRPCASVSQSLSGSHFPVYCTQNDGITSISNFAVCSHLAANVSNSFTFDFSFISDTLEAVFSISSSTPYKRTQKIDKKFTVVVSRGGVDIRPRRKFSFLDFPSTFAEQVELCLEVLKDAAKAVHWMGKPIVYLSGGKDSRLILALYSALKIDVDVVNLNAPSHLEGIIADDVAKKCGYSIEHFALYPEKDLLKNFSRSIKERGGLLNTVPLHYPYMPYVSFYPNRPSILGHAHHQRGGFARTMRVPSDDYITYLKNIFCGKFLNKLFAQNGIAIDKYVKNTEVSHPHNILYCAYRDLRVPNYLSTALMQYQMYSPIVMPLLDERFVVFIDTMYNHSSDARFNLISERFVFRAIEKLNVLLRDIPLHNKNWRFESHHSVEGFEAGYMARNFKNNIERYKNNNVEDDALKLGCDFSSIVRQYLRDTTSGKIVLEFMNPSFKQYVYTNGAYERHTEEYMFAAFGCAALIEEKWY